jgi:hypothetical protein
MLCSTVRDAHLREISMRKLTIALALTVPILLLPAIGAAKGCLKGAAVGGVAGHVAGHHGVVGAAAGCVIQHHREKVRDRNRAAAAPPAPAQSNAPPQSNATQF